MKQSITIALISLALGVLSDYLFFEHALGISFPLYLVLIFAGLVLISRSTKQHLTRQTLWLGAPIIFFGAMVAVRTNELLTFLNVIMTLTLLLFLARQTAGSTIERFRVSHYLSTFFLPFRFLMPATRTLNTLWSSWSTRKDHQLAAQITRGLVIALPLIIIFLALFSSADLVFQKYIGDIIRFDLNPETTFRTVLVGLITLGFIGAYTFTTEKTPTETEARDTTRSNLSQIENLIVLGSINLVFLAFVALQARYLFGGESTIVAQGFTYADYARRGFFELIAVAAISFVLIYFLDKNTARKDTGHHQLFRTLSSVLIAQVGIIIASAWARLALYEQAYGLTTLRLYSHAFIILLLVFFLFALYKIHVDHREETFALRASVSLVVFLGIMNLLNPDAFIAKQNMEHFGATDKLDTLYLQGLSTDAVPELLKLDRVTNPELKSDITRDLANRADNLASDSSTRGWQSWNLSHQQAKKLLEKNQIVPVSYNSAEPIY